MNKNKSALPLILFSIFLTNCGPITNSLTTQSQSKFNSEGKIAIPTITVQCSSDEPPCRDLAQNDRTQKALGLIITTQENCNSSAMNSSSVNTAAFSVEILSKENSDKDNFKTTLKIFVNNYGKTISHVNNSFYTLCAFYGIIDDSTLTYLYFKQLKTSFENIEHIDITSKDWQAL